MKTNTFIILAMLIILSNCVKESVNTSQKIATVLTTYTICGTVLLEQDSISGVKDVIVNLTGAEAQTDTTDSNGDYSFTVSTLGSYTVTPSKNINKLNGVTSADVTAIQQHVANIILINNSYKRIAADVNKNNSISTIDATILNQARLGNPVALNYLNPSWTFVASSYNLTLPPSPSTVPTGYPKSISFTLTTDTSGLNFYGLKRGDVNGSADSQN